MSYRTSVLPSDVANLRNGPFNDNKISAFLHTIATGIIGGVVIDRPSVARDIDACALVCGTTTNCVVMPKKVKKSDGTTVSMLNTGITLVQSDTDPVRGKSVDWVSDAIRQLEPGDVVYFEVTTAPTAGTDLFVTMNIDARYDDPVEAPILGLGGGTP